MTMQVSKIDCVASVLKKICDFRFRRKVLVTFAGSIIRQLCFILMKFFEREESLESYAERNLCWLKFKKSSSQNDSSVSRLSVLRTKYERALLAATCRQRVTKREIWGVNIPNSCEDIIDTVMRRPVSDRRTAPLSLYLASQLMYGLVYVSGKQHEFLFEDLKALTVKLGLFRVQERSTIDLAKPTDESRVTMTIDFDNAPPGFGSFTSYQDPTSHDWGGYFVVSTPKSSEEALSFASAEIERDVTMFDEGAEMLHQAQHSDITMQEVPTEPTEEPFPAEMQEEHVDFLSDFPPLEEAPLEQMPSEPLLDMQQTAPLVNAENLSFLLSPEDAPVLEETLQTRTGTEPLSGDVTVQAASPVVQPRRSVPDSESLILAPVTVPGRRLPRRRHLLVDPVISISSDQMRARIAIIDYLTVPSYQRRASLLETPESMFRRLSRRLVPSGIRNRLARLRTLQKPNDSYPYVIGPPDEFSSPGEADVLRGEEEEQATSGLPISETYPSSMEILRDATTSSIDPSASRLLKTSLAKGLSSTVSLIARDASDSTPMPIIDDATHDDEELMMHIPEPVMEDMVEVYEATLQPSVISCEMSPVSPERTPPPSSAESLTPVLEETYLLVLKTLGKSTVPDLTSFSAVLRNVTQTKSRVAQLFKHLLNLHARGMVDLQQPVAGGDIFIKILSQNG